LSGTVIDYGHGGLGSSVVASDRSQAARTAACSSRATLGDLAGLPLLKSAPCSHREQMSTRGSEAVLTAPICPQCGQTIRVSMSLTTAAGKTGASASEVFHCSASAVAIFLARTASALVRRKKGREVWFATSRRSVRQSAMVPLCGGWPISALPACRRMVDEPLTAALKRNTS
jgi:hypothetical protein